LILTRRGSRWNIPRADTNTDISIATTACIVSRADVADRYARVGHNVSCISPVLRPAYQGSNPISDVWSLYALRTTAECSPAAVHPDHPQHDETRANMLLASSAAGMGFGNAGGKLCCGLLFRFVFRRSLFMIRAAFVVLVVVV
jgi:hypothetical protein